MTDPPVATARPPIFNFTNILVLLGILITGAGVVYFASEFISRLSDWGKLLSLLFISILFVALGVHFEGAGELHQSLVDRRGFRWIRIPTAMFLIGGFTGFVAAIFFLGMDEVDRRVKILVTIALGLVLIFVAARLQARRAVQPPSP
ncbi:MAG: hypothetical protein ACYDCK_10440 [Thermoplasmatota archaeon]